MSWFSNLVHKFTHIVKDLALDAVATSLGFPPGTGIAFGELLLHAHAGSKKAKEKIHELAQDTKTRLLLKNLSGRIKAHPDFAAFKRAAAAQPQAAS